MAEASPALTEEDSEYEDPPVTPAASTIHTRSKSNCVKIGQTTPRVQFDENSLKSTKDAKRKLKKPGINLFHPSLVLTKMGCISMIT